MARDLVSKLQKKGLDVKALAPEDDDLTKLSDEAALQEIFLETLTQKERRQAIDKLNLNQKLVAATLAIENLGFQETASDNLRYIYEISSDNEKKQIREAIFTQIYKKASKKHKIINSLRILKTLDIFPLTSEAYQKHLEEDLKLIALHDNIESTKNLPKFIDKVEKEQLKNLIILASDPLDKSAPEIFKTLRTKKNLRKEEKTDLLNQLFVNAVNQGTLVNLLSYSLPRYGISKEELMSNSFGDNKDQSFSDAFTDLVMNKFNLNSNNDFNNLKPELMIDHIFLLTE